MQTGTFRQTLRIALLVFVSITVAAGQKLSPARGPRAVPNNTLLRILRAEDQRRWDQQLSPLLGDKDPGVRKRAALALGRIGDERAVPALVERLKSDQDEDVRQMIAFALGEIESPDGTDALISIVNNTREPGTVRARAVEALGKIGAVLISAATEQTTAPKAEDIRLGRIRLTILEALKFEAGRRSMPDRGTILLGLTAVLRVRPEGAGPVIIHFLGYSDPRIVADTLNTMARLRLKDGNEQVRQLLSNGDAIVRANAARVIGAAEHKGVYDALLDRALNDSDLRVRVSAIRALGSLKDAQAVAPLLKRGSQLLGSYRRATAMKESIPIEQNELLEIASALGRVSPQSKDTSVDSTQKYLIAFLYNLRELIYPWPPEVEVTLARLNSSNYERGAVDHWLKVSGDRHEVAKNWRQLSSVSQALAEVAKLGLAKEDRDTKQHQIPVPALKDMLCEIREDVTRVCLRAPTLAVADLLQAYAAFKPEDLAGVLRQQFIDSDVVVRATAAELLGEQPPSETNARALIEALPVALSDRDLNDAALSILDALAKQKSAAADNAIKTALDSLDHIIRRRAVALLKANGVGDFSNRIGTVTTRNTAADYRRAIARIGRKVTATVMTSKGAFTIEFFPEEAPLTVDNFVQLARRGYFNGQTVPRVVPNFVIQTGDPRGDQNGGPGYQIRCEINTAPYERGAVGMALSGKDTGGSQWFVTHSPQPHLDGGYTVFGRVIRGMEVVDNIARGDRITRVIVNEL